MDNQPVLDRSLLVPIFISGCSVIGIVLVLLVGRALSSPPDVPMTPSATRFAYVYLGTEPAITTPLIDETEVGVTDEPIFEEPTFEDEEPTDSAPVFRTPTRPGPNTPIVLPSATGNTPAPPTSTSVSAAPLTPGTYDDVDSGLTYSPPNAWAANNAGGTLHVSTVPGSTISFRFIGTQLRIRYQGGLSLGQMRVTVDNVSETLDQSDGNNEWAWPNSLTNVTHTVVITHASGGGVNLDQIIVLSPATPTPTVTPTRTQASN
jgi:carbohydrate esterase-like protein